MVDLNLELVQRSVFKFIIHMDQSRPEWLGKFKQTFGNDIVNSAFKYYSSIYSKNAEYLMTQNGFQYVMAKLENNIFCLSDDLVGVILGNELKHFDVNSEIRLINFLHFVSELGYKLTDSHMKQINDIIQENSWIEAKEVLKDIYNEELIKKEIEEFFKENLPIAAIYKLRLISDKGYIDSKILEMKKYMYSNLKNDLPSFSSIISRYMVADERLIDKTEFPKIISLFEKHNNPTVGLRLVYAYYHGTFEDFKKIIEDYNQYE